MKVFAKRELGYFEDGGNEAPVSLILFVPIEADGGGWKCEFALEPPLYRTTLRGGGVDFLQALVAGLKVARIFLESTDLRGRLHWQRLLDCGLPARAAKPAGWVPVVPPPVVGVAKPCEILAVRRLGYPDESGHERELPLAIYVPSQKDDTSWTCGFAFGSGPGRPIRYGAGADAIEAFLDALAGARAVFEEMVPAGWEGSEDLLDCADFPYKIGRSYRTDLGFSAGQLGEPQPG